MINDIVWCNSLTVETFDEFDKWLATCQTLSFSLLTFPLNVSPMFTKVLLIKLLHCYIVTDEDSI